LVYDSRAATDLNAGAVFYPLDRSGKRQSLKKTEQRLKCGACDE
jgi:hypothetical protein